MFSTELSSSNGFSYSIWVCDINVLISPKKFKCGVFFVTFLSKKTFKAIEIISLLIFEVKIVAHTIHEV